MIFIKFYNIVDSEYLSLLFTQEVKLEQNVQHNRRDDHFLRSIPRQCRFFLCCSRYGAQLRKYAPHMYLTLQHTLGHLQQKFRRSDHGLLNDNKSPENSGFRQGFQVTPLKLCPQNMAHLNTGLCTMHEAQKLGGHNSERKNALERETTKGLT